MWITFTYTCSMSMLNAPSCAKVHSSLKSNVAAKSRCSLLCYWTQRVKSTPRYPLQSVLGRDENGMSAIFRPPAPAISWIAPCIRPAARVLARGWSAIVSRTPSTTAVLTILILSASHLETRKDPVSHNYQCKRSNVLELGNHLWRKRFPYSRATSVFLHFQLHIWNAYRSFSY